MSIHVPCQVAQPCAQNSGIGAARGTCEWICFSHSWLPSNTAVAPPLCWDVSYPWSRDDLCPIRMALVHSRGISCISSGHRGPKDWAYGASGGYFCHGLSGAPRLRSERFSAVDPGTGKRPTVGLVNSGYSWIEETNSWG